jgi:hypothetical protein
MPRSRWRAHARLRARQPSTLLEASVTDGMLTLPPHTQSHPLLFFRSPFSLHLSLSTLLKCHTQTEACLLPTNLYSTTRLANAADLPLSVSASSAQRAMGLGASKEELESTRQKLQAAEQRNASLASEKAALEQKVQAQATTLQQQQTALANNERSCAERLDQKDDELSAALKQKQLAEELRRSDALLAKRLLHSQLKHFGGEAPNAAAPVDGSAMAAAMALAAQDELQLRQVWHAQKRVGPPLPMHFVSRHLVGKSWVDKCALPHTSALSSSHSARALLFPSCADADAHYKRAGEGAKTRHRLRAC